MSREEEDQFIKEIFDSILPEEEFVLERILVNVEAKIEEAITQRAHIADMKNEILMARGQELESERAGMDR